ncbi:anthranilate phosphoribosyltransferase [Peltigera leucophlebia]|nr:anthranilate phosphoribosyltransferase [Peltigera leucophlebia]
MAHFQSPQLISISPLLKTFTGPKKETVTAEEIAAVLGLVFTNQLSEIQCSSLLTLLRASERDREPKTLAKCAEVMRYAAVALDEQALYDIVRFRARGEGNYGGGLCDIVGTGGDGHSTFNVSTTSSILASSLLLLSKHGNRASSSTSGSADLLQAIKPSAPNIEAVTADFLPSIYQSTNYAFLFAPKFHPGMRYAASVRKHLGFRTIFNLLGPLVNPVHSMIEARIVGVAERSLGPVFAEALRLSGSKKALVVCGAEDLDEISCAGKTYCWHICERPNPKRRRLAEDEVEEGHYTSGDIESEPLTLVEITNFELEPSDFGLPTHSLSDVSPGKFPEENAETLMKILQNQLTDAPVLDFVLINTAALFVISGICDADKSDMGHGDDGKVIQERGPGGFRWKEGARRARWAVESGQALASLSSFIHVTSSHSNG